MNDESIYAKLIAFQQTEVWQYREVMEQLHLWAKRFVLEFKLQNGEYVIGVKKLRRRYGQYCGSHNSFGLKNEILLDAEHIASNASDQNWWQVLGTELHELLHHWQQAHGKPGRRNYHNVAFRQRAGALGLVVEANGFTRYELAEPTPFTELLRCHGVPVPKLGPTEYYRTAAEPRGDSKLKLWMCGCRPPVRARVAVELHALCLRCNQRFER